MDLKTTKINTANATVDATISKNTIDQKETTLAQAAAKDMQISGFRKGKVPAHVVKARYGDKLKQDAQNEALRDVYEKAVEALEIAQDQIIGEPSVKKFEENDNGDFIVEIAIATKPVIELTEYKTFVPEFETPKVEDSEVEARLNDMLKNSAPIEKIKTDRPLQSGDYALFDFEGFIDGEAFEGGSAKAYTLEIGSGSFIPGFEDQMIGMKVDDEKDIVVTFPEDYHAKDLAGKEATFKVTLLEIQEKVISSDIDAETLKKFLPNEESPTKELLEEKVKEQLEAEKLSKIYQEEVKPTFVEALVTKYEIDLPENIVEQEIDMAFRNALPSMNEEEIKLYTTDIDAAKEKREEFRKDAIDSVKLTFIVDELARQESIVVDDQEVMQTLYLEALQSGQDPQAFLKQYEEQGLLPAVKMAIVEDKLFTKLFNEKK